LDGLILVVAALTLIVGAAAAWYGFKVDRRSKERSDVSWETHSVEPGLFAVANSGLDTAYDVSVTAWDRHDVAHGSAKKVRPARHGDEEFDIIEVRLKHRSEHGPDETDAPKPLMDTLGLAAADPIQKAMRDLSQQNYAQMVRQAESRQVYIKIVWRSRLGQWSDYETHDG
jgi:hypothetical protein